MKELVSIQSELKCNKSQFNAFGKYKYRSCEDILEAVKPLLVKQKCVLTVSDEVVQVGDRIYVKATAKLEGEKFTAAAVGFAREPISKKGMDESQITGAASSYARKHALNGLFAIDDNADADTLPPPEKPTFTAPPIQQDEYCGMIYKCKTLKELQELWGKIPADMRKELEAVKDEQKGKLS